MEDNARQTKTTRAHLPLTQEFEREFRSIPVEPTADDEPSVASDLDPIGPDPKKVEWIEAKMRQDAAIAEKAANHVDWLLGTLRPLLIDQFLHGFKHGLETRCEVCEVPEASEL